MNLLISASLLLMVLGIGIADESAPGNDSNPRLTIQQALEKRSDFEFQKMPLSEVVDLLRKLTGINILLDPIGLQIVGVDSDKPVDLQAKDISIRNALNIILTPLELTTLERSGVLIITDADETAAELVTKLYPVLDFVAVKATDGKMLFVADQMIRSIENTIEADSWENNGGNGSVDWLPSEVLLVVSQTSAIHEQLEQFFADVRKLRVSTDELSQKLGLGNFKTLVADTLQDAIIREQKEQSRAQLRDKDEEAKLRRELLVLMIHKTKLEIEKLQSK